MVENRHHSGSRGSSASGSSAGGSGHPQPTHSRSPSDVDSRVHPPPPLPHGGGHLPLMHMPQSRIKHSSSLSSASEFTSVSQQFLPHHHHHHHADRMSLRSMSLGQQVPAGVSASRASFQQALDNPCEYFIDVM